MAITHINPEGMHTSIVFSHGVVATGSTTLYVGGQNGTDTDGHITGDVVDQTEQALRNVLQVLTAAGASQTDVAKLTIYLHADADVQEAFGGAQEVWGDHPVPLTVVKVAGLARPEALVEIDAVAVID
ncbi:RidA family protein [Demequina sp. B12]|uniref:RidA family protein n=1 Tax=Demequina sp. B12 TaxID=2992757 RepID=UPI00237B20E8|nr:RidA family protein [Demequina sp. B12]MDE0572715.1 RidA family protein [Demequina sp. B12]